MRSGQVLFRTSSTAQETSERPQSNTRLRKDTPLLPQVLDYPPQILHSPTNIDVVDQKLLVLDLEDVKAQSGFLDRLLLAGAEGALSGTVLCAAAGCALFGIG